VRLELYAEGINGGVAVHHEMGSVRQLAGAAGSYAYSGAILAARSATDYTARMVPRFDGVHVPLESGQILWLR
jgi:starch phosphorylase